MDAQAKQQIVERIKQSQNVLVTVSTNPTVDQLAACVGVTLLLNRMDKHGTAVFSGVIPSTIEFLQPERTIERNTDSLRDFIISLDKNKADKLRYKVEDKVVRIFITPYRTSLGEKDLVFSQGDFNVEVVLALGVTDRRQIDAAITAHGRILHDATVISVNTGPGPAPQIGQLNWKDPQASSLSEMIVSISEAFGTGLIDNQMATAFLTGIVAETERFRNAKTTPKVMTMAAQLMAAGANQQLIASKLEPQAPAAPQAAAPPPPQPAGPSKDGKLAVSHEAGKKDDPEVKIDPNEIRIDEQGNLKTPEDLKKEIEELKKLRARQAPPPAPAAPQAAAPPPPPPAAAPPPQPAAPAAPPALPPQVIDSNVAPEPTIIKPSGYMGEPGPARTDILPSVTPIPGHHELLDPYGRQPALGAAFTANTEPEWRSPYNTVPMDPLSGMSPNSGVLSHTPDAQPAQQPPPPSAAAPPPLPPAAAPPPPPPPGQAPVWQPSPPEPPPAAPAATDVNNARNAVESAFAAAPYNPALNPVTSLNAQPLSVDLHPEAPAPPPPAWQPPPPPAPAANGTPSMPLPNSGTAMASTSDLLQPAPPPVPPPLPPVASQSPNAPTLPPPII